MTALKSLNFITLQKPSTNPTLDRRARVIARLEEQKLLLNDPTYKRSVRSWTKNEAGEKSLVETKQRVLPWWSAQPNGSYVFFIRSGWKPIEFEKGKAAIAVPSLEKLPIHYRHADCSGAERRTGRAVGPGQQRSQTAKGQEQARGLIASGSSRKAAPFSFHPRDHDMPTLIVWDVKTVPDLQVFADAKGLAKQTDDEIRDAMGPEASNPLYRSIVCIGWLIAHFEADRWTVDSIYADHVASKSEQELIKQFFDTIADLKPQLVTFNGSSSLEYRAMRHKLAMPQYFPELHNPYALDDLSLCDILSPSSQRRISLRELCAVLGLRYDGLEDDDVEKYYREGRVREIAEFCEREVVSIFRIWLRRELFQGRLSNYGFQRSEGTLEGRSTSA